MTKTRASAICWTVALLLTGPLALVLAVYVAIEHIWLIHTWRA